MRSRNPNSVGTARKAFRCAAVWSVFSSRTVSYTHLDVYKRQYLPCTGDSPPFWTAVTSTLALLLGSFEVPFGEGEACHYPVPLGLQLARLLAIVATLSGATSVPVSYTHLDVYKRQVQECLPLRHGFMKA